MGTLATFAMVGSTVFAVAAEAQRIYQDPREGAPRHEEVKSHNRKNNTCWFSPN